MDFTVSLAGKNYRIKSIYNEIYDLCVDYITDSAPHFTVETTKSDIEYERERSALESAREKKPIIDWSPEYLETLAVYRKIAELSLDSDTFLMHGSVVALGGAAYMFIAPSGTGKTTHTDFWLQTYPDAYILNGDKPLISVRDSGVFACGTPWAGKEGKNRNAILPLKAVCLLFRGKDNRIERLDFDKAFPLVITQTYRPTDEKKMKKTLQLIKTLGERVKLYALYCNLDPDAARVAKEGIDNE